jgi:predicted type IV restriction endonuclease
MSDLRDHIETVRRHLASDSYENEAHVRMGIVDPILKLLGWDLTNPAECKPEYRVGTRRVDIALLVNGQPEVLVEVKQPGGASGSDEQLFQYAFIKGGVPLAVLTDGATWSVYVPSERGEMHERRAVFLDLSERAPSESASTLSRYLARDAVASGDAVKRARRDCQRARQRRGAKAEIHKTWSALVSEENTALLEFLSTEVESVSGFQPEDADLLVFLRSLTPGTGSIQQSRAPRKSTDASRTISPGPEASGEADGLPSRGYSIEGEFFAASTGINLLHDLLSRLAGRDKAFLGRLATRAAGKKRAFVAREKSTLYPDRPDLRSKSRPLPDGYWLATNNSTAVKRKIIAWAAEEAGLDLGSDLRVRFAK